MALMLASIWAAVTPSMVVGMRVGSEVGCEPVITTTPASCEGDGTSVCADAEAATAAAAKSVMRCRTREEPDIGIS